MNAKVFSTFFYSFVCFSFFGQHIVKGTVFNTQSEPIPYASVLLLNHTDSTLIKGLMSDVSGNFYGEISQSKCLINVTALGYDELFLLVEDFNNPISLQLNENVLTQFDVVAKTPLFTFKEGNMVINVDNTFLQYSTSIAEIISKSPGLTLSGSDIEVIGKGTSIIFVDNQKVTFEMLKSIPVSQIKSIEVIKNPDSQYDVGDMAVVLVTLKSQTLNGFQGAMLFQFTQGFYQLGFADFSLNYHKK